MRPLRVLPKQRQQQDGMESGQFLACLHSEWSNCEVRGLQLDARAEEVGGKRKGVAAQLGPPEWQLLAVQLLCPSREEQT